MDAVGRPLPHLSAQKHTTGEAVYVDDMPFYRGLSIITSFGVIICHGTDYKIGLRSNLDHAVVNRCCDDCVSQVGPLNTALPSK